MRFSQFCQDQSLHDIIFLILLYARDQLKHQYNELRSLPVDYISLANKSGSSLYC